MTQRTVKEKREYLEQLRGFVEKHEKNINDEMMTNIKYTIATLKKQIERMEEFK